MTIVVRPRSPTSATYLGTMAALKRMLPRDRGTIIQVGSALAYRAIPLPGALLRRQVRDSRLHRLDPNRVVARQEQRADHDVQLPAVNTPQFNWCKTNLPRHPQPVPPIYQPEVPAEAIVSAAAQATRVVDRRPNGAGDPREQARSVICRSLPGAHRLQGSARRISRSTPSGQESVRARRGASRDARDLRRQIEFEEPRALGGDAPSGPARGRCARAGRRPGRSSLLMPVQELPPGWATNPSAWPKRVALAALALAGLMISTYLTLYQVKLIGSVWDPAFPSGSPAVSSWTKPVPDAAFVSGPTPRRSSSSSSATPAAGGRGRGRRWRSAP